MEATKFYLVMMWSLASKEALLCPFMPVMTMLKRQKLF
ncbi:hypothetical protein UNSWCS_1417 [Campylobacter concisus UNSWCS]|uniref:Uncharacterized protein n=1 Tax=Campylobacter concisus UNSWCS TaxID=1242968 RepID=U2F9X9_9BACT|nr:hypothetical protein UNSWCS_1417 [Campylobacter concisus UNSWCS]